ncbi:cytochrome P450 [Sphingomonas sp.]|uniref:cytochrome P450 n=1 Tax=Sphingomonas sp. TaxID=28214 RepID=UPI003AFFFEEC
MNADAGAAPIGAKANPIDFDHESAEYAARWTDQYRTIRESGCPIAWSGAHGGYFVPSRYNDIVAIAQDSQTFSSAKTFDAATGAVSGGVLIPAIPFPTAYPIETDRPVWDAYRSFINRRFAPKAAEARRDFARHHASRLLDQVIETGEIDFIADLTGPLPAIVTMDLMGLPLADWRDFAEPLHEIVYTPKESAEFPDVAARFQQMFDRCLVELRRYRELPPEDNLLSVFAHEPFEGRPLTDDEVLGYCNNILAGGVDTTTALTTNVLVYLWRNPDERQRLIGDPALLPTAREEFVRFFAPQHAVARNCTRDVEVGGVLIAAGDRIYMPWGAGNRDPEVFEQPDFIDMARFPNRHIGFGAGAHRCIGSFVARVMFEEMVKQVLSRMPNYRIDIDRAQRYRSIGTINGWMNMPATFAPGTRLSHDTLG